MSLGAPPPATFPLTGSPVYLSPGGLTLLDRWFQALGTTLELAQGLITCAESDKPHVNRPA